MLIHRGHQATTPPAPIAPRRIRLGDQTSAPAPSRGQALRALFLMGASIAAIASPGFARAADCSITYTADARMSEVIERDHFAFDGYETLCSALQAADLKLDIIGDKGVLNDRAFAWVSVRLARESTTVTSDFVSETTKIATPADDATATKIAMHAINDSLANMTAEKDKYIQSVAAEEARLRMLLTAKATDKH
jgi:mannose/cellobiose epimerase-like protein (N-acyl-D-glucosamine 2-epimerase family)